MRVALLSARDYVNRLNQGQVRGTDRGRRLLPTLIQRQQKQRERPRFAQTPAAFTDSKNTHNSLSAGVACLSALLLENEEQDPDNPQSN